MQKGLDAGHTPLRTSQAHPLLGSLGHTPYLDLPDTPLTWTSRTHPLLGPPGHTPYLDLSDTPLGPPGHTLTWTSRTHPLLGPPKHTSYLDLPNTPYLDLPDTPLTWTSRTHPLLGPLDSLLCVAHFLKLLQVHLWHNTQPSEGFTQNAAR